MITIRPLTPLSAAALNRLTGPYLSYDSYRVQYEETPDGARFSLERVPLAEPVRRQYDHIDEAYVQQYLVGADVRLGAYEEDVLVGALIADRHAWNETLWVLEFHVAAARRGQGIGRQLMEQAARIARDMGLRVIACETQNHNGASIAAYRALGFRQEGVDISYYSNAGTPDQDVAVFMKRRVDDSGRP